MLINQKKTKQKKKNPVPHLRCVSVFCLKAQFSCHCCTLRTWLRCGVIVLPFALQPENKRPVFTVRPALDRFGSPRQERDRFCEQINDSLTKARSNRMAVTRVADRSAQLRSWQQISVAEAHGLAFLSQGRLSAGSLEVLLSLCRLAEFSCEPSKSTSRIKWIWLRFCNRVT